MSCNKTTKNLKKKILKKNKKIKINSNKVTTLVHYTFKRIKCEMFLINPHHKGKLVGLSQLITALSRGTSRKWADTN